MGYILGLDGLDGLGKKMISECNQRIKYQDLIVERTSTKSALTISDEQKEKKKQEAKVLADKIKETIKETNMACETKCTEKKKQQIKFKKISNTLWKCEDPKWPLQYLGAINFHKLESIYEFEISGEIKVDGSNINVKEDDSDDEEEEEVKEKKEDDYQFINYKIIYNITN